MPTSVTAILVAAEGEHRLRAVLDALTLQTRMPDRLVVVQLGADPATSSVIAAVEPTVQARVHARAGFGQAVETGVRAAGLGPEDGQWLWLLATDTAPEPAALERLLQAVEAAPSVVVAGPKQMQWDAPQYLHAFGETMTPGGTAVELAEPELDQAQYDRLSDVMAVAAGGMLVQERAWRALGGFDHALPAFDDALDFCVRARLAGHRVQLVPGARVRVAGLEAPGARLLGGPATLGRRARYAREAQLHRRLVYASLPVVPLHWLSLLPLAAARALGQLLRKQPEAAPGELLAAFVVGLTRFSAIARARSRIGRTRTVGWAALAPLRQPWREVRYRRALARDNGRPAVRQEPIHFVTGGGLGTTVGVAAVSAMLFTPLMGADALSGGTLLPLGSVHNLWRSVGWGVRPLGEGFVGPADPFAVVLALLGSLTPWHPSAAVVGLWLLALPIAAAGGWLATARFTRRPPLRIVGGLLWAAAPTLLLALDEGRIGGVLVHLAAPFALLAAFQVRRSWTASAWLALLGALIAACSPSLLPLLAGTWVAAVVLGRTRRRGGARVRRIIPLPLPTLVLFGPLIAEQALHGRLIGLLADPGPVAAAEDPAHVLGLPEQLSTALQLAAGWPAWAESSWEALTEPLGLTGAASAVLVWALGAPLLLLALVGLFWPGRSLPLRVGVAGVGGLVVAVLATRVQVVSDGAVPIPAWSGAGLSLAWLGVLEAAVVGLDRLSAGAVLPLPGRPGRFTMQLRAAGAATIGFTAVVALLAAAAPLLVGVLAGTAAVRPGSSATVPPLVAAEAQEVPDLGLLTLQPQANGGFRKQLFRGEGQTMERLSTLATTAGFGESARLARLAAGLVQPTGDDLRASLDAFRIGYVLLLPGADDAASRAGLVDARAVLGANALLTTVSSTSSGTLFRFGGLDPDATDQVVRRGPSNTGTPLGLLVLLVQGLVLGLTALLALPTRRLAVRFRPPAALAAPRADIRSIERAPLPAEVQALRPEQAAVRQPEEVGAWR